MTRDCPHEAYADHRRTAFRPVSLSRPAYRERPHRGARLSAGCRRGRGDRRARRTARLRSIDDGRPVRGPLPNGPSRYRLRARFGDSDVELDDPYRFPPILTRFRSLSARRRQPSAALRQARRPSDDARRRRRRRASWCWRRTRSGSAWSAISISGTDAATPMRVRGNGYWEIFVPRARAGRQLQIRDRRPATAQLLPLKSDPLAFAAEMRPLTASIVVDPARAAAAAPGAAPASTRSTRRCRSTRCISAPGGARHEQPLADLSRTGRAAAGLCRATWASPMSNSCRSASIRSTAPGAISRPGCYAPTSRFGTPEDFAALVDALPREGIGVLLDWVPGHFPDDPHGLAHFDGTALYEHANPLQGRHLDWGTLIYNYGRTEVANFLRRQRAVLARALRHRRAARRCRRLDALSRLQPPGRRLDPEQARRPRKSRGDRLPAPLQHRGVRPHSRNATTAAEESTAWPHGVAAGRLGRARLRLQVEHGLDARHPDYIGKDPIYRRHHHGQILFGLHYAFSENFILPLSHDEVVHGKRSILGRMPGDDWQRFANLRAYYAFMFGHPGKKLMFMGCEFAPGHANGITISSLDWHLLEQPAHAGIQRLVRDLNRLYRDAAGAARARLRRRRLRMAGHATTPTTASSPGCARATTRTSAAWSS